MKTPIQLKLIAQGVKNLRQFGYPDCDSDNIMTDQIYKRFFISMLQENLGQSERFDAQIQPLINEIGE